MFAINKQLTALCSVDYRQIIKITWNLVGSNNGRTFFQVLEFCKYESNENMGKQTGPMWFHKNAAVITKIKWPDDYLQKVPLYLSLFQAKQGELIAEVSDILHSS